ncbi:MAG: D-alanine--D-alanine ligase A, partial [Acidobacteria bacterium]|nr:D-alanine--D-alanine ligase A [Acidobacteriota bacterium]
MKRRLRVGVLLGGRSVEHSVSLQSARFVLEVLRENRHEAVPIGITPEGKWVPLRALPSPETRVLTADIPAAEGSEAIARQLIGLGCEEPAGKKPAPPLDVVFPVLHGIHGEDGTLQGLLE